MKLHLLLLASLINLAMGGFMVELTGSLTADPCTGGEYADFKHCLPSNVAEDDEEEALFSRGGERALGWCSGCRGGSPRGTFCFTVCGGRRRLEEGTNLRRLQDGSSAEYKGGAYSGTGLALEYATEIIECLGGMSTTHLCLGDTVNMTLIVSA
jgi:hypothetical protein